MRRVQRTIEAPSDWTLELVRVPAGSEVTLDLRLESVMDGVLVSGTVRAEVAAECGRCLEPVRDELVADIQELFAYDQSEAGDDALGLEGDFIDFEPVARDSVVLSLPLNPVCDETCEGLCAGCGGRLRELGPDHVHDETDSRWAALTALRTEDSPASPEIGS
jgi:uncharacterized protein